MQMTVASPAMMTGTNYYNLAEMSCSHSQSGLALGVLTKKYKSSHKNFPGSGENSVDILLETLEWSEWSGWLL